MNQCVPTSQLRYKLREGGTLFACFLIKNDCSLVVIFTMQLSDTYTCHISSENIQKKEGGPDRSVSDNQSSSVTLNELAMKARKIL